MRLKILWPVQKIQTALNRIHSHTFWHEHGANYVRLKILPKWFIALLIQFVLSIVWSCIFNRIINRNPIAECMPIKSSNRMYSQQHFMYSWTRVCCTTLKTELIVSMIRLQTMNIWHTETRTRYISSSREHNLIKCGKYGDKEFERMAGWSDGTKIKKSRLQITNLLSWKEFNLANVKHILSEK